MERSIRDLGDPDHSWQGPGKPNRKTSRRADGGRESDQFIVLRDDCAVHRGKGLTGIRSLHRKH